MGQYIIRRILIAIPTFFIISIILFSMLQIAPGDPILQMFDPELVRLTDEQLAVMRAELGLDQPLVVQYWDWLLNMLQGNLGLSLQTRRPVVDMIGEALPITLRLVGSALILAMLIGIPIGIISAVKQYSKFDYFITGFTFLMMALPVFFFGMLMIYIFSIQLGWFPTGGIRSLGRAQTLSNQLWHMALPVLMMALKNSAIWARYTRSSFLEVLNQDYMRTARSKGFWERYVLYIHGFPNAVGPLITIFGLMLPTLIVGAVITETIFAWPGVGRLVVNALNQRDFPMVMGITSLVAVTVLAANIITDLLYAVFDPRIRYD